ncbi:MAG: hypothetical protein JOZ96_13925 [Acidobacteria bacterium]|nr:hypothetical protein [Acidobacteriota bacterium]
MIDLRSHILDGTPCGPPSFADSLEICSAAAADGITTIVATLRWEAGSAEPPLPFEESRRKIKRLEAEMGGALTFKLGFALQFSPELPSLAAHYGSNLALAGGHHILISLPSLEIPPDVEDVFQALMCGGFSVILAHPECNPALRRATARLTQWMMRGLILQVDAASVAGTHGREVQRCALEWLRTYVGKVVVASNMRFGTNQKNLLVLAREVMIDKLGARLARGYISDLPASIIRGGVLCNNWRRPRSQNLTSLLRFISSSKVLTARR